MSRKPAAYPMFLKKFRGTEEEQAEFLKMLPGDAREDFEQVVNTLKSNKALIEAIDCYRMAHSAYEASGENTTELSDSYANLLLVCDKAKE